MRGIRCSSCEGLFIGAEYSVKSRGPYCWECWKEMTNKIKSDGGSTSYYDLPEHATELRHLISYKGMSKSRGDIFKACYRLGEKDGADLLYDLNKMEFFIKDLKEMYARGEHI